ncbi:MAG: ribosomal RNA small subunit methyltransferase A [Rickettsiales bacterium]|nr:MAG: ribosomal RNA small subunit methyltransferase A [Rickettsiales bacterium]
MLSIAKLASKHGIIPKKKYGQNFIFDETLCDRIVRAAEIGNDSVVLEVGPGTGGLTRSILKTSPAALYAIETDSRCLPLLEEIKLSYPALEVLNQDALKVKLEDVISAVSAGGEEGSEAETSSKSKPSLEIATDKLDIVANLPYNVGSQLLVDWLCQIEHVASMTLMLQKEVVDRITSESSKRSYGRLSIICQLVCDVHKCFDVSPKAFVPQPKIWSSIVRLVPKKDRPTKEILLLIETITRHAFSGRRKMIKSSLKNLSPQIGDILDDLGIANTLRAENLSPEDYLRIACHEGCRY